MTGHLGEATETWTDLDDMLAAELPPCEVRSADSADEAKRVPMCGRTPSVAVVTFSCPTCGQWRRAACAPHVDEIRSTLALWGGVNCGKCGARSALHVGGVS